MRQACRGKYLKYERQNLKENGIVNASLIEVIQKVSHAQLVGYVTLTRALFRIVDLAHCLLSLTRTFVFMF